MRYRPAGPLGPLRYFAWGVALGGMLGALLMVMLGVGLLLAPDWVVEVPEGFERTISAGDLQAQGWWVTVVGLGALVSCLVGAWALRTSSASVIDVLLTLIGAAVGFVAIPWSAQALVGLLRGTGAM